jgi:site-specific DNA-cytosine methylase
MKFATIVPLIGGMTVAPKAVLGIDPEFFLSYAAFAENEKTLKHNFPGVPHYLLDTPERDGFVASQHQDLDFVTALCPCAGLSLLSSGSIEHRTMMNQWMINSAKLILSEVRPRVFWGENAPALYTNRGKEVREELYDIAKANGYSMSLYYTNTMLHGIPQSRKRSFYFFWRDTNVPMFEYFKKPARQLGEYLREIPKDALHHKDSDIIAMTDKLMKDPFIQFLQAKYNGKGIEAMRTWLNEANKNGSTMNSYMIRSEQMAEANQWFLENGFDHHYKDTKRILGKIADKKGFWDGSWPMYRDDGIFSALIGRTFYAIHPSENRLLTLRECMHLMGLPLDFEFVGNNMNAVCQNVPICTASDMVREVAAALNGDRIITNNKFMMQNNLNEKIDYSENSLLS